MVLRSVTGYFSQFEMVDTTENESEEYGYESKPLHLIGTPKKKLKIAG